jgi:predicted helicase
VAKVLKEEFNRDISDENVHILDPFVGTGTFIVRLIQSGLLGSNLTKKYETSLHANEIVLLAYYIASINIENAYHETLAENVKYSPFKGICLTDTFQIYENDETGLRFDNILKLNSDRVESQQDLRITVIFSNPPYSIGQRSQNDNLQNQIYPELNERLASTYAIQSSANLKKALYDSYVKAFRWSTDRLDKENGGIIAFVTNAGWIEGNAMDGMRKCFEKEFSSIYVFNLRGNQRCVGDFRQREGGKIFETGSMLPISINIFVKNPKHLGSTNIFYHAVNDYMSTQDKLSNVKNCHDIYNDVMQWDKIIPNKDGDWINQRGDIFQKLILIGDKKAKDLNTYFTYNYSLGLATNRDAWCYNFSRTNLGQNIKKSIDFYNDQVTQFLSAKIADKSLKAIDFINLDPHFFSWDRQQKKDIESGKKYIYNKNSLTLSLYRPFQKEFCYFNRVLNNCVYQLPKLFPTPNHQNVVICVSGIGGKKEHSTLISNIVVDLNVLDAGTQCFPRFFYQESTDTTGALFQNHSDADRYTRHDGITDFIHKECLKKYGTKVTKDDIFYYVYGILHSQDYRAAFSADLKKSLPRIPLVDNPDDFKAYSKAGTNLAKLHLHYEEIEPYKKVKITGLESNNFKIVDKIKFGPNNDKTIIQFNPYIKISNIPIEAYEYIINGRSAIEWIIERYKITVHSESKIKNDPNDWTREHNNPRYIFDLLLRIITVSLETQKIVKNLPRLDFT